MNTFPNTLTSKKAKRSRDKYIFFDKHVRSYMSRTAMTLKFKMCLLLDEECSRAEMLFTYRNLPPLMTDKDNNFGGSLVSDCRK